jgi:hypothetical protein
VQPRAHCSDLTTYDPRDFFISHCLDKAQHQHLPMFGGQFVESRVDALRVFRREVFLVPIPGSCVLFQPLGSRSANPEHAHGPVPRDAIEPRSKSTGVGQSRYGVKDV